MLTSTQTDQIFTIGGQGQAVAFERMLPRSLQSCMQEA